MPTLFRDEVLTDFMDNILKSLEPARNLGQGSSETE